MADIAAFAYPEKPVVLRDDADAAAAKEGNGNRLLPGATVDIACDVRNPFVGPQGATMVFSRQKGAKNDAMKQELEAGMVNVARAMHELTGTDVSTMPGAGAAGGISGGFTALMGPSCRMLSGMRVLSEHLGLEDEVRRADLVITGEGSYDAQTSSGKVCSHVQSLGAAHHTPVAVVCGVSKLDAEANREGNVFQMVDLFPKDQCMAQAASCLEDTVARRRAELLSLVSSR